MGILKDTCAEIYNLSGWSTIALTGGPNPALKNKISRGVQDLNAGPGVG